MSTKRDNQVKESEGQKRKNMTIAEYRTHLVARCLDTGRDWRRITCDNVSRAAPGTYRDREERQQQGVHHDGLLQAVRQTGQGGELRK